MRIAVITDHTGLAAYLVETFAAAGHRVVRSNRGQELLTLLPDLDAVVLDTKLPDVPGIHVLQRLRELSHVPVIMLMPHDDERLIIRSLRAGADDCVAKPPRPVELAARLEAIIRRWTMPFSTGNVVVTGDVEVDLGARHVEVAGAPITLTRTEFDILAVLAESPGMAVSREYLMCRIWGNGGGPASRPLDVHIAALRTKLQRPGLITTMRGFGYRWGLGPSGTTPGMRPQPPSNTR